MAFVLNGWIILGSFHKKFVTFHASLDTLFGLINGDDIYGTFTGIDEEDDIFAFVYCRIYMYIFLALFLYFVLNLFTSLVITAHEASLVSLPSSMQSSLYSFTNFHIMNIGFHTCIQL